MYRAGATARLQDYRRIFDLPASGEERPLQVAEASERELLKRWAATIGRSLLYEEIRAGKLRTFKVGTRTLIAADDLTAWLAAYRSARP